MFTFLIFSRIFYNAFTCLTIYKYHEWYVLIVPIFIFILALATPGKPEFDITIKTCQKILKMSTQELFQSFKSAHVSYGIILILKLAEGGCSAAVNCNNKTRKHTYWFPSTKKTKNLCPKYATECSSLRGRYAYFHTNLNKKRPQAYALRHRCV